VSIWIPKVNGDIIDASHINALQTLKADGTIDVGGNVAILGGSYPALAGGTVNLSIGDVNQLSHLTTGIQNIAIGKDAGKYITTGGRNYCVGVNAGLSVTTGAYNLLIGELSGYLITTGGGNVFVGHATGPGGATPCDYNSALGTGCLGALTTGYANSAYGYLALGSLTSGGYNVGIGTEALFATVTGNGNTAIGFGAGLACTLHSSVFIGNKAGEFETGAYVLFIDSITRASEADARVKALVYGIFDTLTASQHLYFNANVHVLEGLDIAGSNVNVYTGRNASVFGSSFPVLAGGTDNLAIGGANTLVRLTSGISNFAMGNDAGAHITTGERNFCLGINSGVSINTGSDNILIGDLSGYLITTGHGNTFVGSDCAPGGASPCNFNSAFGNLCMGALTTGYANTAIGYLTLGLMTSGNRNVGCGTESLYAVVTGEENAALGFAAGQACTLSHSLFLGNKAGQFETAGQVLYIDTLSRINEADARVKALVYGIFDAVTANQRFRINGRLGVTEVPHYDNDAAAAVGGLAIGEVYRTDADPPVLCIRVA
jgi:hypothetical protein